jgi:hypothetical protein
MTVDSQYRHVLLRFVEIFRRSPTKEELVKIKNGAIALDTQEKKRQSRRHGTKNVSRLRKRQLPKR